MIQQEYILLIMNCKKYVKKAEYQKQTWLAVIPAFLKFYHVIGEPELDEKYRFDNQNHILWIKVDDDYNSLPKKVIRAYHAIYETFDFKYIFKTDDDQILTNIKFLDTVKGLLSNNNIKKIHYGGHIVDVTQNYLSQYYKIHPELPEYLPILQTRYCSGRFYFLSRQAITNLLNKQFLIEKDFLEDYAIGYNLDNIYKTNMLQLDANKYFIDMHID